jgi:protein-tyrosine phosphatase
MSIINLGALDINKVANGLYQGAWPPFGDQLAKCGFDILVLCAKENQYEELYHGMHVILAPGDDDLRPERMKHYLPAWKTAAEQVAQHVKNGKTVLVTCMAGLNRSGMVTAMALYLLTGWSGSDVVNHIQMCRKALCNNTFASWLRDNLESSDEPQLPSGV